MNSKNLILLLGVGIIGYVLYKRGAFNGIMQYAPVQNNPAGNNPGYQNDPGFGNLPGFGSSAPTTSAPGSNTGNTVSNTNPTGAATSPSVNSPTGPSNGSSDPGLDSIEGASDDDAED